MPHRDAAAPLSSTPMAGIALSSTLQQLLAPLALLATAAFASTFSPDLPTAASAQQESTAAPAPVVPYQNAGSVATDPLITVVSEWNRLRQTDSLPFEQYATFMLAHPGWPGEAAMRKTAEARIDPIGVDVRQVVSFFTRFPPQTNTGRVRYAEALAATGHPAEAREMARSAWTDGVLNPADEGLLLGQFGPALTIADHDRREDRLLWARATAAAQRQLALTSPDKRALFEARIAYQTNAADAATKGALAGPVADSDAGYRIDRALWLRNNAQGGAARAYLASPHQLAALPADPARWLDGLLIFAQGAATDNQSTIAYDIARQIEETYPAGTLIRDKPFAERDDYTSLAWLAGVTAYKKLGRPADAVTMFDRYAAAAQTPQTQTKGWYWAAKAARAANNTALARSYFMQAAMNVDQFYGQLASEDIGRPLILPPDVAAQPSAAERAAFEQSELVRAARLLGQMSNWEDQTVFLRALASTARTDSDHILAGELARTIGRPDLGVMVSRNLRNSGARDPVRIGFPQLAVPAVVDPQWVMVHAISRQESQFDRNAVSRVGARGLMQLMPGTARETATKLGLPYDFARLTSDPGYNVTLGGTYFQRMLDYYSGSHVLAVAAYNAGPGNVNKFIKANGDPRLPGTDVVEWIEAIPLTETRGYVQRVLENAVVYELMHPQKPGGFAGPTRLSAYLGMSGRQSASNLQQPAF